MNDVRIRSIDIASHKLDDSAPPSYGAMNVEVGGKEIRLFLGQEDVDALVAAADPIMRDALRKVSDAMNNSQKPRIVA